MKWRVMEFEDKEFLWLHLIWNLTPKIYSGSVAHPPCLMPSPSFSRATRQEPLTVPCGPNKQSHRIFFRPVVHHFYFPLFTTTTSPQRQRIPDRVQIAKITLKEKSSERGREPTKTSTHMWRRVQELNGRTAHSPLLHPPFPVSISYQKNVLTFEMAGGTWYPYLAFYNGNVFTIVNKEN